MSWAAGSSLVVISGTGSGKSLGCMIPIINRVLEERERGDQRAPRIISYLQGLSGHEKAAKEAAEQENLISTIDEIS